MLSHMPRGVYMMSRVLCFIDWFVHSVLLDEIVEQSITFLFV